MPTYSYKCESCEHEIEAVQKIRDEPLIHCPACDEDTLRRKISKGNGFILKGVGNFGKGRA